MAVTRLSDLSFDEDVYLSYAQENRPDRNAYVQSGVAVTNDSLREAVTEQGTLPTIPYWKDLDASSENVSSDDPNTSATPGKIGTDIMVARQLYLNNGWGAANLAASINGGNDPMRQIAARTGRYWDMRLAARVQRDLTRLRRDLPRYHFRTRTSSAIAAAPSAVPARKAQPASMPWGWRCAPSWAKAGAARRIGARMAKGLMITPCLGLVRSRGACGPETGR